MIVDWSQKRFPYGFQEVSFKKLKKALQDVVKETELWAHQYEADGRYKDAAYLYGRIHHDLMKENQIIPTLAAVYENIGDFPAAEFAQEQLMGIVFAKGQGTITEEQLREVKTFSRLLNIFHTRLQVLGSASQTCAKLSIVYRAAALDLQLLNAALLDQSLIVPDHLDLINTSSLHIAVKKSALNLARLLLQKGANPNLKDFSGYTPLHMAVVYEIEAMVRLLLSWGADTEMKEMRGSTPIQIASSRGGNESILLLLIDKGANIETRDSKGQTPLGNAIGSDSQSLAQKLIRHGADVNAKVNKSDMGGTLLFQAVSSRNQWAVNMLLENGANPQAVDGMGRQVLYYAVERSQESMVKVLLDHGGVKYVTIPPILKTMVHLAVSRGNLTIIEMILKAGADTNEKDCWGNAPLHDLIGQGPTDLAQISQIFGLLLEYGAQVNTRNNSDNTPLHLALTSCRTDVVQMLLDAGADPCLVNWEGKAALDLAQELCQRSSDPQWKEILELLNSRSGTTSFK